MMENPSSSEIANLYRYLSGSPVNFEEAAGRTPEYYRADEFDKPQILQQMTERLRSEYQAVSDIDVIRLRTNSRFSDYDTNLGAFKFELFKPGTYFTFRDNRDNYFLFLDNSEEFRDWVINVPDAKAIRKESPYGNVVMEIDIRPFDVNKSRRRALRGQIVGLKVFLQRSSKLVYEKNLEPSQYRSIAGASGSNTIQALSADKHQILGLNIKASQSEFQSWAQQQGYKHKNIVSSEYRIASNDAALNYQFDTGSSLLGVITGSTNADQLDYDLFGPKLDCRATTQTLESCGLVKLNDQGQVISAIILQSATHMTQQQLVDAMIQKYGPLTDSFDVTLMKKFRAKQYVWGASSKEFSRTAFDLSNISGRTHWQVEAVITQPTSDRFVALLQINAINTDNTQKNVKF